LSKDGATNAAHRWRERFDSDTGLAALLVLLVLYIFIIYPLFGADTAKGNLGSAFFSLILLAGVIAVSRHKSTRISVVILAIVALVTRWMNVAIGGRLDHLVASSAAIVFFAVQIWFISKRVFRRGGVNVYRILGAVAIYLLIAITWANIYVVIHLTSPQAFSFAPQVQIIEPPIWEMLYFSVVTLTTLGYGDITAVQPIARSAVMLEGLIGQLYPAIVLALLVTQYRGKAEE